MLFINAVNEATREKARSFLGDDHLQRIVDAYRPLADQDGFPRVVTNEEIRAKGSSLGSPFMRGVTTEAETGILKGKISPYGKPFLVVLTTRKN
ncbi:MAG: N-6 DNA methylase [Pseudomonadota bacterium]